MIIAKTITGLIRINRITVTTQEQSNMMLAKIIKRMKMCENHQVQNVYI